MDLKELIRKSKEDCHLGDELDRDAQDLPRRKAQWSEWLSVFAVNYKKAYWQLSKVRRERYEYYLVGYNITLDKRDIRDTYMPGDDQIIEAEKAVILWKQKIELCERTISTLNRMGFDIKNVIDYRKLMSGIV